MASQPTADRSTSTPTRAEVNRALIGPIVAVDLDLLTVFAFVVIGRNNHDESPGLGGVIETAAPFLIGLAVSWLAARAWKRPFAVPTGLIVWVGTVALGMACRRVFFDEGTAFSFVIVASVFLGVFLNGWRAVARRVVARPGTSR